MNYAIVIPTYNAGALFEDVLQAIDEQALKPLQLLLIDSGSVDNTLKIAEAHNAQIVKINNRDFDHGSTRNKSVSLLKNEVMHVVFLTQDAVLANKQSISSLLKAFDDPKVAVAYGRQLPAKNASKIAEHARLFNYPAQSKYENIKNYADKPGIKTIFSSNSFAAYDRRLFNALGQFNAPSIMSEDLLFAANAMLAGYSVCYQADAMVFHSHNYTLKQHFSRYFDTGYSHFINRKLLSNFKAAENEGCKYIVSEFKFLFFSGHILSALFYLPLLTCVRYLAFKVGYYANYWPQKMNRCLSMNKQFWEN
jgi:rhamnosyltransferase